MKKNMTLGRARCRPRRKEAKSGFLKTIDNNSVFKALYQACCKLQTLGKKFFLSVCVLRVLLNRLNVGV